MKRFITALLLGVSATSYVQAQDQAAELSQLGCGTVTTLEEIQRVYEFSQLPPAAFKTTASVDTIPLTIHIVGRNDGSGYYSYDHLFQVLCELNTRFAPVNMYFVVKWPVRYINNSAYYEHNNANGAAMMGQNNVPNTVNVYFVSDPAGACGYYSPFRDALAIAIKCSAPTSTTLTHEMGHFFGLPHTFYGWENGNTPDLRNQENVARTGPNANCATAGDGFCDTEADYIADRWNNCNVFPAHTDQHGVTLTPDPTVYMSYSPDKCMTRFTSSQIAYMRNNLHSRRTNLLNNKPIIQPNEPATLTKPEIVYPSDLLYANYHKVIWRKVPGAEYYHVKVSANSVFVTVYQESITADTSIELNIEVRDRANLKVDVTPLKSTNVCGTARQTHPFLATDTHTSLGVDEITENGSLRVIPNPVVGGNAVRVQLTSLPEGDYQIHLYNMNGQKVSHYSFDAQTNNGLVEIPTHSLPAGMYFLKAISTSGAQWTEKLLIQN